MVFLLVVAVPDVVPVPAVVAAAVAAVGVAGQVPPHTRRNARCNMSSKAVVAKEDIVEGTPMS